MSKGDKQRSNREAKKPKADKKLVPPPSSFPKTQSGASKLPAKPPAK